MARKAVKSKGRSKKSTWELSDSNFLAVALIALVGMLASALLLYKNNIQTQLANEPKTAVVELAAQNGSGESGTATLTETNGKTTVVLKMSGFPKGVSQPAHIHLGSCPKPGEVKYPLEFPLNGDSSTTLDVTLAQLKSMEPLAINVHKSGTQASVYVSCGNLSL